MKSPKRMLQPTSGRIDSTRAVRHPERDHQHEWSVPERHAGVSFRNAPLVLVVALRMADSARRIDATPRRLKACASDSSFLRAGGWTWSASTRLTSGPP